MGLCCSKQQEETVLPQSPKIRKKKLVESPGSKEVTADDLILDLNNMLKICDNKLDVEEDKITEFIEHNLQLILDQADGSALLNSPTYQEKLKYLGGMKEKCLQCLKEVKELRNKKEGFQTQVNNHIHKVEPITIETINEIEQSILKMSEEIKEIDTRFKNFFGQYLTFSDNTQIIDKYFVTYMQMHKELPQLRIVSDRLQEVANMSKAFIDEALIGNVNYDREFYNSESTQIERQLSKLDHLIDQVNQINHKMDEITKNNITSTEAMQKDQVKEQLQKLIALSYEKDLCMRELERLKNELRTMREQYYDMHVEQICQSLDARVNQAQRDERGLQKILKKQKTHQQEGEEEHAISEDDESSCVELVRIQDLMLRIEELMGSVQSNQYLKTCLLSELQQYVMMSRELTNELMAIEGDLALREIQAFISKAKKTFAKIEQKIVDLNDAKYKLMDEELEDLDYLTKTHLSIKTKFQEILDGTKMYPPNSENNFDYKIQVEDLQKSSREIKNIFLDSKLLWKNAQKMRVPEIQHFSDIVDEMLFRFREMKRSEIIIQKLATHQYRFGTKVIQAKVQNGILLIRVGGGYESIDAFYNKYGEQEIIKQYRQEWQQQCKDVDQNYPDEKEDESPFNKATKRSTGKKLLAKAMDANKIAQLFGKSAPATQEKNYQKKTVSANSKNKGKGSMLKDLLNANNLTNINNKSGHKNRISDLVDSLKNSSQHDYTGAANDYYSPDNDQQTSGVGEYEINLADDDDEGEQVVHSNAQSPTISMTKSNVSAQNLGGALAQSNSSPFVIAPQRISN